MSGGAVSEKGSSITNHAIYNMDLEETFNSLGMEKYSLMKTNKEFFLLVANDYKQRSKYGRVAETYSACLLRIGVYR